MKLLYDIWRKTDRFVFWRIKKTPNESHCSSRVLLHMIKSNHISFSARSGVRTLDTLIKSQVLCQLS